MPVGQRRQGQLQHQGSRRPGSGAADRLCITDTFHLTFEDGRIASVTTTSNGPPVFEEALDWIGKQHPEVIEGPCKGFFNGGPTPQACVREVVKQFAAFAALRGEDGRR